MTLFKATKDGPVAMTAEEEAALRSEWKNNEIQADPLTIEERVAALEKKVNDMAAGKK